MLVESTNQGEPMDPTKPFHAPWPMDPSVDTPEVIELEFYKGSKGIDIGCTQLPGPASRQRRIVQEWCEFFQDPTPVRDLVLSTRTPVNLFEAVCRQSQLRSLFIKWGAMKDLTPIANLKNLKRLNLGSCSISDLSPIGELTSLEHLFLGNLSKLSDYSPLAKLTKLKFLLIEGAPWAPKDVWIDDLDFLRKLPKLRGLQIAAAKIRDDSWLEPLLQSKGLEYLDLPKRCVNQHRQEILAGLPKLKHGLVVSPTW